MNNRELLMAIYKIAMSDIKLFAVCEYLRKMSANLKFCANAMCRVARMLRNIAKSLDFIIETFDNSETVAIEKKPLRV